MKYARLIGAVFACMPVLFGFAGLSQTALAAPLSLIDRGSTTYDPNTGLEWLDLTIFLGMSFNQTSASSYVMIDGFRFATEADLLSLYQSVGIIQTGGEHCREYIRSSDAAEFSWLYHAVFSGSASRSGMARRTKPNRRHILRFLPTLI